MAVVGAGLLVVGACGGDDGEDSGGDGGGDAQRYVGALAPAISEDSDIPMGDEAATCVATAIVDLVGADALAEAGVSPEELADADNLADAGVEPPDDAGRRLGEEFGACDIAGPLRTTLVENLVSGVGAEVPPEATGCVEENLGDEALTGALGALFADGSEAEMQQLIGDAIVACPDIPTAAVVGRSPAQESPETVACVRGFVEDNPDLVRAAFADDDQAAAQELGAQLAGACQLTLEG